VVGEGRGGEGRGGEVVPLTLAAFSPSLWDATISSCERYHGMHVRCRTGKGGQQWVVVSQKELIRQKGNRRRMRGFGWTLGVPLLCWIAARTVSLWASGASPLTRLCHQDWKNHQLNSWETLLPDMARHHRTFLPLKAFVPTSTRSSLVMPIRVSPTSVILCPSPLLPREETLTAWENTTHRYASRECTLC
jgi:hypothetical protein